MLDGRTHVRHCGVDNSSATVGLEVEGEHNVTLAWPGCLILHVRFIIVPRSRPNIRGRSISGLRSTSEEIRAATIKSTRWVPVIILPAYARGCSVKAGIELT